MMLSTILASLRSKHGISQEKLSSILNVSRQAVQKWETGITLPDINNLIGIASYFNVSIDYLLNGKDNRTIEEIRTSSCSEPSYEKYNEWEAYYKTLAIEYQQCIDEGKNIAKYQSLFKAVSDMPNNKYKAEISDIIYKIVENAEIDESFKFYEPSDLKAIISETKKSDCKLKVPEKEALLDKITGAWYGRICGCLLGKPVEGMKYDELTSLLQRTNNSPMYRYIVKSDINKADVSDLKFPIEKTVYDDGIIDGMPVDDDTNYIIIAYKIIEQYGPSFTPEDVAEVWLALQSKNAYCTAERVAFRNFLNGYKPPESAKYKNSYREWIGAQIRGDFFGWINPGNPQKAAAMAWRDGCISHVKNGIYGEMWVSAMLSAACCNLSVEDVIRVGLSYIPAKSRLYKAINNVLSVYADGKSKAEFFDDFHKRWNDYNPHHWCHVISNSEIVAASLLYGNKDYSETVCTAVEQGFDTDCTAATAGSIVGMMIGEKNIPAEWKGKINGKLNTSIFGFETVLVDQMAEKTYEMILD